MTKPRTIFDVMIDEAHKDAHRPWWKRTTGGLLVAFILAVVLGNLAVDLIGRGL